MIAQRSDETTSEQETELLAMLAEAARQVAIAAALLRERAETELQMEPPPV
jgi:hypothetical protein